MELIFIYFSFPMWFLLILVPQLTSVSQHFLLSNYHFRTPFSISASRLICISSLSLALFPIPSYLCFPSGRCSSVCPITLISLIYTWTSAAVRYALSACTQGVFTHHLHISPPVAIPSCSAPLCLPSTVEVSRCRGDSGAVSSSFMRGDFRYL